MAVSQGAASGGTRAAVERCRGMCGFRARGAKTPCHVEASRATSAHVGGLVPGGLLHHVVSPLGQRRGGGRRPGGLLEQ
eukprot:8048492-Pyramimonas_sp.AAC.1